MIEPSVRRRLQCQPNGWSCGPSALRHALLVYGHNVSVRRLAKIAGTTRRDGTPEAALQQAAGLLGYRLRKVLFRDPELARAGLRNHLATGVPALLPVDKDEGGWGAHWIVVVRAT